MEDFDIDHERALYETEQQCLDELYGNMADQYVYERGLEM